MSLIYIISIVTILTSANAAEAPIVETQEPIIYIMPDEIDDVNGDEGLDYENDDDFKDSKDLVD